MPRALLDALGLSKQIACFHEEIPPRRRKADPLFDALEQLQPEASRRFARTHGIDRLLGVGFAILAAGAACLLLAGWLGGRTPLPMILAVSVVTLANGFLIPLSFAGGVTSFPDNAGAASGLMGAMHLIAGSLAIYLVAAMPGTVAALAAFVTVVAAIGCIAFPLLLRWSNTPRTVAPIVCSTNTTA